MPFVIPFVLGICGTIISAFIACCFGFIDKEWDNAYRTFIVTIICIAIFTWGMIAYSHRTVEIDVVDIHAVENIQVIYHPPTHGIIDLTDFTNVIWEDDELEIMYWPEQTVFGIRFDALIKRIDKKREIPPKPVRLSPPRPGRLVAT